MLKDATPPHPTPTFLPIHGNSVQNIHGGRVKHRDDQVQQLFDQEVTGVMLKSV